MKIAVNAGELAGALALAAALSEDRRIKNIQSLEAVNLAADGQAITILANALDHALQLHIPATIEIPGALAVPGQRLAALAAGFSATETIHIGDGETTAHIACGRSRFRLPVIPQDELPAVPAIAQETGCVELAREEALTLFERPFFAAGTEATRYYLSGIFLRDTDDGALMAVATDGHRLAQVTVPGAAGLSQDSSLIVPRAAVKIILKLLADKSNERIVLRRSVTLLAVEAAGFNFTSKLIDGSYPDYERVIPKPSGQAVTVERAALVQALERVRAVADPSIKAKPVVGLQWQGDELRLCLGGHPDAADDVIDAAVDGAGRTAAQIRYVAELLGSLKGNRVRLDAADADAAALITDPDDSDFLAVQMPYRVPFESSQAA